MKTKNYIRLTRLIGITFMFTILPLNSHCQKIKNIDINVYSSSKDGDRLTRQKDVYFTANKESALPLITVSEDSIYQKIDGFGATFNEAGMICLNSLKPVEKDKVLQALFSPNSGAGYTLMKSPIGACDFASAGPWYTYNDTPGDTTMQHFSIERDLGPNGLITFIKSATRYGKFEIQSPMDYAPDWMYYGMNKKVEMTIKPEYYNSLATYYIKYLKGYSDNGVIIDYLVLFNESDCRGGGYSSLTYKEIGTIIKTHLSSRLKASGLTTKIMLGELCGRDQAIEKYPAILDDPEAKKHISKLAVHGYDLDKFSSLTNLHNRYPDLPIWMTEVCYACDMGMPLDKSKCPEYEFSDGEFWGNMIINDLKNWVSGWIYWNMILDQEGGPWLVSPEHGDPEKNAQHPVVIINRNTGKVTYTGLYYYLAHFSKFVRPGAYRINCTGGLPSLNFVGFKNTDGSIVLNVINNGDEATCKVSWNKKMAIQKFKANSITTLKWDSITVKN